MSITKLRALRVLTIFFAVVLGVFTVITYGRNWDLSSVLFISTALNGIVSLVLSLFIYRYRLDFIRFFGADSPETIDGRACMQRAIFHVVGENRRRDAAYARKIRVAQMYGYRA